MKFRRDWERMGVAEFVYYLCEGAGAESCNYCDGCNGDTVGDSELFIEISRRTQDFERGLSALLLSEMREVFEVLKNERMEVRSIFDKAPIREIKFHYPLFWQAVELLEIAERGGKEEIIKSKGGRPKAGSIIFLIARERELELQKFLKDLARGGKTTRIVQVIAGAIKAGVISFFPAYQSAKDLFSNLGAESGYYKAKEVATKKGAGGKDLRDKYTDEVNRIANLIKEKFG